MEDEACLSYLQEYRKDVHFDVLLKCWELPYSVNQHSSHCGSHTYLIQSVCEETGFLTLMRDCQRRVEYLLQQQDTVRVACCCDRGRHRSVAVATILQGVCEVKGYTSTGPYHIDECKWKEKICTNCKGCRPNNQKTQLYEIVATHL